MKPHYSVKQSAITEIEIQKSRFIGRAERVTSEEEARAIIEKVTKEHWKATHNCYAYIVGENAQIQKSSDDGEPAGTAGIPMLEVIKKKQLRDTLVIVTRYFGGIKLGAGGLVRAYAKTCAQAIAAAGIVEHVPVKIFDVVIDYALYGTVDNALKHTGYLVRDTQFTENVTIKIAVRLEDIDTFTAWMTNICNGQCQIIPVEETFLEVDVKDQETG